MSIAILAVGTLTLAFSTRALWMIIFRRACEAEACDFLARKFGGSTRDYADDARWYWVVWSLIWGGISVFLWLLLIYLLRGGT